MGATRLASENFSVASSRAKRCSYYLEEFVFLSPFSIPTRLLKNSPTRDASPPLEIAFRASVWCLSPFTCLRFTGQQLFWKPAYSFKCTICLHSTPSVCTALIINVLRSVDNFVFYLHCLHLSAHFFFCTSATAAWCNAREKAVWTIKGGSFFGRSNQKIAPPMPNCAGGMTIVQLGADLCNEGRADECRQVQTSADGKQGCLHSVIHW